MTAVRLTHIFALAAVFGTLPLAAIQGCSSDSGQPANCTPNADMNGLTVVKDGCNQFAVCLDKDNHAQSPCNCCSSATGSQDIALCLYGYGVTPESCGINPASSSVAGTGGSIASGGGTSPGTGGAGGS